MTGYRVGLMSLAGPVGRTREVDYIVREFKKGDPHDAELLAAMWNASEEGWPGGWTQGVPETAERILDHTGKADRLAIFVVERDGEITGYCDVRQEPGRAEVAYVPLLNVRPACHGTGMGKALLLRVLDLVVGRGYKQLTLGTWAGNMKAVPLYKKTGFFWRPETDVFMQNFVPTALTLPIARDFFSRHDWYRCFRRELKVAPDEMDWRGTKVYPYCFEEGEERFLMWVDKESEALTAVETDAFFTACVVGKEEVVCGLKHTVRWEIARRKAAAEPLRVTLMAEGEAGINLSVLESLEVADRAVVERTFTVSPDIKPKERGLPAPQIRSTLVVNGLPVVLGTAVKPVQPVEILFGGQNVVAGKPDEKVTVRLRSHLDFPVQGDLTFAPHPSLRLGRLSVPFTLEPRSWTSCTFLLQAQAEGAFTTKVQASCAAVKPEGDAPAERLVTHAKPVVFRTVPLDTLYTWHDEEGEAVVVETPGLCLRVNLRGGSANVSERVSGRQICTLRAPELGPPFTGWRHVEPLYPYRLEEKNGKAAVTLFVPVDNAPGVTVERTITIGAGSFLRVDHRVTNATDVARRFRLRSAGWSNVNGAVTLPLRDGLLHEPTGGWGGFPLEYPDVPKNTEEFAEGWAAWEEDGLVAGLVWGDAGEFEGLRMEVETPEMPAQSCCDLAPMYYVAGRGDWEVVRQLWRWLKQPGGVREECRPTALPVLSAGVEPGPLLVAGPETATALVVHNRRGKVLNGELQVEPGSGLILSGAVGALTDVKRGSPFRQDMVITARDLTPRVANVRLSVDDGVETRTFEAPAIVLGDGRRECAVRPLPAAEGQPAHLAVENGWLSLRVAPGFLGAVTALERDGLNHVLSAYPEAGPKSFLNPWFGGIHPCIGWMGDQRFVKEKFAGGPAVREGARGLSWHGVQVSADLQHKDLRWLRMEVDYLTLGGSNVLAVVQRLVNRTDSVQSAGAGIAISAGVGGGTAENVLHYAQERPRYETAASTRERTRGLRSHRRDDFMLQVGAGRWAAVENPTTGHVLAVVATHPRSTVETIDEGEPGIYLMVSGWFELEPGETKQTVTWVVLTNSVAQAEAYRALGEVWELP